MTEVAIVVTGEPIQATQERCGGWPALIRQAAESHSVSWTELDARAAALPSLLGFDALVVTGSSASVTERAEWMLELEARLREAVAAGLPILGICFGHQLLGQALGGQVERNPRGREIGSVRFEVLAADPLLDAAQAPFLVNMTHVDTLVELPRGARVLGRTLLDSRAAVRFGPACWGVQFHPEISKAVLTDYVEARVLVIQQEGLDVEAIRAGVSETPAGRDVLRRFLGQVAGSAFRG